MSELAVFLSGHLPKGLLEEPFNKIVRVHNSIKFNVFSSTVRQEVSYARFAGMCQTRERECAKHLSDKPFAQVHVRKKHLKSQTKSWLFCENPPFFSGEYQNGTLK